MWSKYHKHDKTDNYKKTGEDTVYFIFHVLISNFTDILYGGPRVSLKNKMKNQFIDLIIQT